MAEFTCEHCNMVTDASENVPVKLICQSCGCRSVIFGTRVRFKTGSGSVMEVDARTPVEVRKTLRTDIVLISPIRERSKKTKTQIPPRGGEGSEETEEDRDPDSSEK